MGDYEQIVDVKEPMPKGYGFLRKGDVYKTGLCRRMTHSARKPLFVVQDNGVTVGLRAPRWIMSEVFKEARATEDSRRAAVQRRDDATRRQFDDAITRLYPHSPAEDREKILRRALKKKSGRVGRTGKLDIDAKARLAVWAHIRHAYTDYDGLLRSGLSRDDARKSVDVKIQEILQIWQGKAATQGKTQGRKPRSVRTAAADGAKAAPISRARPKRKRPRAEKERNAGKQGHSTSDQEVGPSGRRRSARLQSGGSNPRAGLSVLDHFSDDEDEDEDDSSSDAVGDDESMVDSSDVIVISDSDEDDQTLEELV
jgi:hypothetical protein